MKTKKQFTIANILQAVSFLAVLATATMADGSRLLSLIPAALAVAALGASMWLDRGEG